METEQHKKQFRGWFIPVDIVELFQEGVISSKEMILTSLIDSFCKKDCDCFASNEYLGKSMHLKKDTITRMISRLKKMKILGQTSFDGRKRYLKTCFTTTNLSKTTNQTCEKSHLKKDIITRMISRLKKMKILEQTSFDGTTTNLSKTTNQTCEKSQTRPGKSLKPDLDKNPTIYYNKNYNKSTKNSIHTQEKFPFEDLWKIYDKKRKKDKAKKKWNTISNKDKKLIMEHVPEYVKSTPDKEFRRDLITFLNQKGWKDEIIDRISTRPKNPVDEEEPEYWRKL